MRTYAYVRCSYASTEAALNAVKGCRYVEDAGRGHGPELWSDDAEMPADYPGKVALVHALPGGVLQVVPLVEDNGALLARLKDAGLEVYDSAKALAAALPAVADAACYRQRALLDAKGDVIGSEKATGAPLQVAACLAGDDPEKCADPEAAKLEAEPLVERVR